MPRILMNNAESSNENTHAEIEQVEQQNMTVWEASSRKAREYMLSRQLEQGLNQDPDPILFPCETSPFDFNPTSLSREHIKESSLTVHDIWF
jgi:hypothetical protein